MTRRSGGVPPTHVLRMALVAKAPLALSLAVVALVALLASATPRLVAAAATSEVRASVARVVGPDAGSSVLITVPMDDAARGVELRVETPDSVTGTALMVLHGLDPGLRTVLSAPVSSLVGRELKAGVRGSRPVLLRFAYLVDGAPGPDGRLRNADVTAAGAGALTWVAGHAPEATGTEEDVRRSDNRLLPIEVAISDETAKVLDVSVGDALPVSNPDGEALDVRVVGIFHAVDPAARVWAGLPTSIVPQVVDGGAARVEVVALTSAASVPDARLAMRSAGLNESFRFDVVPEALNGVVAADVAREVRALVAAPTTLGLADRAPTVTTALDRMLQASLDRIASASAQATLVTSGVVTAALLLLGLATGVLVRRRAAVLAHHRSHGASLAALAVALGAESVTLVLVGGAVGVGIAGWLAPGAVPWGWVVPPLVLAAAIGPLLGTLHAARSQAPPPARSLDRRSAARRWRRPVAEAALLVIAGVALVTLRSRGVMASGRSLVSDLVVVAAPTLVAAVVGVALVRVLPLLAGGWRRIATRTRGPVPLVAAARVSAPVVAVAALVLTTTLLTMVGAVRATVHAGQVAGSWESVGADVRLSANEDPGLPDVVPELAHRPGVSAAAAALVTQDAQILGDRLDVQARLVVVDPADLERLLDATAIGGGERLRLLGGPSGDRLPALTTGIPSGTGGLTLHWRGGAVPLDDVGAAPRLPVGPNPLRSGVTVVVARAPLVAAIGAPVQSTLAWAVGPSAAAEVDRLPGLQGVEVSTRAGWLADLRESPIVSGFSDLLWASGLVLGVLGVLVVVLAAAAGAPGRARVGASLRVLGLSRRAGTRAALAELAGPAIVPALAGVATGAALVAALAGALGLAALTGQGGPPSLVLPGWVWLTPPAVLVALGAVVAVEASARWRVRLGQVMRTG